jgi:hypothetical protein
MTRRLYLVATMVAILSAQEPYAKVHDVPVRVPGAAPNAALNPEQTKTLASLIQKSLLDRYAAERGLTATDAEYAALRAKMPSPPRSPDLDAELRSSLIQSGLNAQQAEEQVRQSAARRAAQDRQFFGSLIQNWKVGRDIYNRFGGGRIRLSAFGFHDPMDAMEKFLIAQESSGAFRIPDPATRAAVWRIFQDKTGGDGTVSGPRAREIYNAPPWESASRR